MRDSFFSQCRACLTVLCLVAFAACAKMAPPLPPLVIFPEATQQLQLIQTGTAARLLFPLPGPEIKAVWVYRQCGTATAWNDSSPVLARVEVETLKPESPGLFAFIDPVAQPNCRYSIRYINQQKRVSPFSNTPATASEAAPKPPANLKAAPSADHVTVTWDPPQENLAGQPAKVVGYLVNGRHSVSIPRFEDREFTWGTPKTYRVQAVAQTEAPLVLSDSSPEITITPVDTFGPPPPGGLVGLLAEGKVQLLWQPPDANDVKGYRIYRGTVPETTERIAELVTENAFTDASPPAGDSIYYRVSSVDQKGNEGEKSEPVRVERGG
ncbi:MAG: hypothetical protein EHM61_14885 [Acidobacteria bacterium]|nr:MAG: hypothetical protein EHM61_14885 [Acidobacteriota bacterium]